MIALVLLALVVTAAPQKCITSCTNVTMYGKDVLQCFYDELPKCERFQPVCKEVGNVVCKPRSVNLGKFDPVPTWYVPAEYKDLTAPSTAGSKE